LDVFRERFKPKSNAARVAKVLNEMNGNKKLGTGAFIFDLLSDDSYSQ
jgi:hypothetical protein